MFEHFRWYKDLGNHQTAWAGHILYIYNQLPIWKPKTVVELGVYYGHSLATMAESCEDHKLNTKLYGVDHFKGDDHSCLLYTSPSPRDRTRSRMPSSA